MIYLFSTLAKNYSSQAHCDIHIAFGLADGLQSLGYDVCVLYGGTMGVFDGVMHRNWETVRLDEQDTLLYYSNLIGDSIFSDNFSGAGLKIWYPSWTKCYHGDYWDYIMIDNAEYVERVQQSCPFCKVIWSMFGCPNKVQYPTDPYPSSQKNLFYAGRLMEHGNCAQVSFIRRIMNRLPPDYHVYIASACVWMPYDCEDPRIAGHVATSPIGGDFVPYGIETHNDYVYVPKKEFIAAVDKYFDSSRIHFLGPRAYGSFDGYIKHADAILDFGYTYNVPGPNCKIMEPLRYGVPVVADGVSFSFPLVEQYGDGYVVPYRDTESMCQAIEALPPKDLKARSKLGDLFNIDNSWRQRAANLVGLINGI